MRAALFVVLVTLAISGASTRCAHAAITIDVNKVVCSSCNPSSNSVSVTTTQANEVAVVLVAGGFGGWNPVTLTDTAGWSWTCATTAVAAPGILNMCWALAPAATTNTITLSASSGYPQGWVWTLIGANIGGPIDRGPSGSYATSDWTCNGCQNTTRTLTTANANDLLLCGQVNDVAVTLTTAGVLTQDGTNYEQWFGHTQLSGTISGATYQLVTNTGGVSANNSCVGIVPGAVVTGRARIIQ